MNIWKIIWKIIYLNCGERYEDMIAHRSYIHKLSSKVVKLTHKRSSGLNGIRTHDICDTGAVLYQLSYQASWEPVTSWVRTSVDGEEWRGHTITSCLLQCLEPRYICEFGSSGCSFWGERCVTSQKTAAKEITVRLTLFKLKLRFK